MKWSSPRSLFSCIVVLCAFTACNKEYTPVPNPTEQNIIYLTGNNGAYTQWRLTSLVMKVYNQSIPQTFSDYTVIYYLNTSFKDSDGMRGTWTLIGQDSLSQKITNVPTGVYALQGYHIDSISATKLTLRYLVNNKPIIASYTAER